MKRAFLSTILAVLATSPLFVEAALPPFYQSLNEYKALLTSQELAQKLGSAESIRDIERTENGFLVRTTRYMLNVEVVYDPPKQPGPSQFHFVFHDLERFYEGIR